MWLALYFFWTTSFCFVLQLEHTGEPLLPAKKWNSSMIRFEIQKDVPLTVRRMLLEGVGLEQRPVSVIM